MANSTRKLKVADLLQRIIAELLIKDFKDPRVPLVSVADVQVSRDLSFAKVFISMLGGESFSDDIGRSVLDKLNDVKGQIRYEIGRKAALRIVPELAFVWDRTLERGHHLSSLIDHARRSDSAE